MPSVIRIWPGARQLLARGLHLTVFSLIEKLAFVLLLAMMLETPSMVLARQRDIKTQSPYRVQKANAQMMKCVEVRTCFEGF